jgi:hypothetical protein
MHEQEIIPKELVSNHSEFSKIVAKVWNRMEEGQKSPWRDMAQREKEEHRQRYPKWNYKSHQQSCMSPDKPGEVMTCDSSGSTPIPSHIGQETLNPVGVQFLCFDMSQETEFPTHESSTNTLYFDFPEESAFSLEQPYVHGDPGPELMWLSMGD